MSNGGQPTEPGGYLSEESKRRFTLVAGVLGAVFFLAQILLPMIVMFLVMVPMMIGSEFRSVRVDRSALWRGELWFVERRERLSWRDPERSAPALALAHVRLSDLAGAGPVLPLDVSASDSSPELLPMGGRLWLIGGDTVGYYEGGSFTRLNGASPPPRASRPFRYRGRPAVISLATPATLATLGVEDASAAWTTRELALGLPPESGSLRGVQAVEANGGLFLFAQLCTESPDHCSLSYRELGQEKWLPLVEDLCSCASWVAIARGTGFAVVLSEREGARASLAVVTVTANGPSREPIAAGSCAR